MTIHYAVHPDDPQPRLLKQASDLLASGHVVAIPTDSNYALACHLDDAESVQKLRRLRGIDETHPLSLLCRDLKELAQFAKVDNQQFRLLKKATPGPYTFILPATKEVPKRVSHPKRHTIGLRVPEHKVLQALLAQSDGPFLATTLILPDSETPLNNAQDIMEALGAQLDGIVDSGGCPSQPSTVVDLSQGGVPLLVRQGRGDLARLGL